MPHDSPSTPRLPLVLLTLAAIAGTCTATIADPDLWGHTLYGLRALDAGVLVEPTDPFSYTAVGARWINHEWLSEMVYAVLWRQTGDIGLWMWRNVLAALLFATAAYSIARARVGLGTAVLLLVFGCQTLEPFHMFVRPQLATFVLFAAWLTLVRRHWDDARDRGIWWLPVLSAIWVNVHGGFLAGLAIHAAVGVAYAWRAWFEPNTRPALGAITLVGILAGLATIVNPYGWEMHRMLWVHLVPAQAVREWAPLWSAGGSLVYYLPFVPLLVALVGCRRWQAIEVVVMAATAYAAAAHLRHVALLSVATLVMLPRPLDEALRRLFPRLVARWNAPRPTAASAWRFLPGRSDMSLVVVASAALLVSQIAWLDGWSRTGLRPWRIGVESWRQAPGVPLRALTVLEREQFDGNLITDYAWAQYVIWHRFPENPVAFDGRYRTVYPADIELDFLAFLRADPADPRADRLLDAYPSEIVLLPSGAPAAERLATRTDWAEVYADDQARLFVKRLARFERVIAKTRQHMLPEPVVARWNLFPAGPDVTRTGQPGLASAAH